MALRPRPDLEAAIRSRVARVAVGPSAVRGTPRGTAEAARRFLRQLPLRSFRAHNRQAFVRSLDRETTRLQAALPARGRRWGVARKLLNIYPRLRLQRTPSVGVQPGTDRAVLRSAPRLRHGQGTARLGRRGCVAGVAGCWTPDTRSQRALPSRCDSYCQGQETTRGAPRRVLVVRGSRHIAIAA
jgi:hypothetical protein